MGAIGNLIQSYREPVQVAESSQVIAPACGAFISVPDDVDLSTALNAHTRNCSECIYRLENTRGKGWNKRKI